MSDPTCSPVACAASLRRMGSDDIHLPPVWLGALRLAGRVLLIVVAAYGIHLVMDWATARAETNDSLMIGVLTVLLLAYALLIAVPFMPGIEIGVSLLILKGAAIAPLVYLATVLGLLIAFAAGRFLPHGWLHGMLADLRLERACLLVDRLAPMTREERLSHLTDRAPRWLRPLIGAWRYPLLAALINVPGNAVVGGGGGIALTAGFSRLFRPGWT
ncbi:MAG: hypothetical protein AAF230_07800, partial [Pseudomonadota bacterium]